MLKDLLSARHFNCAVSLPALLTVSYLQEKKCGQYYYLHFRDREAKI